MQKILLKLLLLLSTINIYSQNIDSNNLDKYISELNDDKKFEESILYLENIIQKKSSTDYDKYLAYLQKSYTYKRLFNYSKALHNLEIALEFGEKSSQKKIAINQIKLEKLFIEYDTKNYDKVYKIISTIKEKDLQFVNPETKAFYYSILASISMKNEKYEQAELYLNKAINITSLDNPKHLPNIYRVKVILYGLTNEHEKALKAYEDGLFYAQKYNVDIYVIIMNEAITKYYSDKDDFENAYKYQKIVSEARSKYDAANKSGSLHVLEDKILKESKEAAIKYEKNLQLFFIILSILLIALIIVLLKFFAVNKQKNKLIEIENNRIRNELEIVSKKLTEKEHQKTLDLQNVKLTTRQKEIIDLVKLGKTNKEIGADLYISENTVKYHLKIIYDLLKIDNRFELK